MSRRPKRIAIADVNVRAVRGPKPDDRHCWYWQAQRSVDGVRRTVWSGWATRVEATRIVIDLVALAATRPQPVSIGEERPSATQLATVCDLLETWVGNLQARLEAGDITKYGFRNAKTDGGHLKEHLGSIQIAHLRRPTSRATATPACARGPLPPSFTARTRRCARPGSGRGRTVTSRIATCRRSG